MTTELDEFEFVHDHFIRASSSTGADLASYVAQALQHGRHLAGRSHRLDPASHASILDMLPGIEREMKIAASGYLSPALIGECFDALVAVLGHWVEPKRVRAIAIRQRVAKAETLTRVLENTARSIELVDLAHGAMSRPVDLRQAKV